MSRDTMTLLGGDLFGVLPPQQRTRTPLGRLLELAARTSGSVWPTMFFVMLGDGRWLVGTSYALYVIRRQGFLERLYRELPWLRAVIKRVPYPLLNLQYGVHLPPSGIGPVERLIPAKAFDNPLKWIADHEQEVGGCKLVVTPYLHEQGGVRTLYRVCFGAPRQPVAELGHGETTRHLEGDVLVPLLLDALDVLAPDHVVLEQDWEWTLLGKNIVRAVPSASHRVAGKNGDFAMAFFMPFLVPHTRVALGAYRPVPELPHWNSHDQAREAEHERQLRSALDEWRIYQ